MRKTNHQRLDPKEYQYVRDEWRKVEQPLAEVIISMGKVWESEEHGVFEKGQENVDAIWEARSHEPYQLWFNEVH